MRKEKYIVVRRVGTFGLMDSFVKEVNDFIKKGYSPVGGILAIKDSHDTIYMQSMVLKKD